METTNLTERNTFHFNENDTSYSLDPVPLVKQPIHLIIVYSIAYGLVFIFAVVGNTLVITVIYKDPTLRNITNYFILNLAVADVLVALFVVPMTLLANIFSGWRFGAFLCKAVPYTQSVVQCASVNTLAAIAIDRYLAICYTRHKMSSIFASRTTIIIIWVFAFTIMLPQAIYYERFMHPVYTDVPMCNQLWPDIQPQRFYFLFALFVVCYVVPLAFIMLCYLLIAHRVCKRNAPGVQAGNGQVIIHRSKVKVLKMLGIIVCLFAFSWLPLYGAYIKIYFGSLPSESENLFMFEVVLPVAQWLGASNSGVNPIIYCFFSKKYRRGFKNILYCRMHKFNFRRHSRTTNSLTTRYLNIENSSGETKHADQKLEQNSRVSSNKYMVVAFCNGKMTVSFRRENADKDDSSF